jgi:hypothetical protein
MTGGKYVKFFEQQMMNEEKKGSHLAVENAREIRQP